MRRRLLNITSIVCLVMCVAFMGMWVRSYHWCDCLEGRVPGRREFYLESELGHLRWRSVDDPMLKWWRIRGESSREFPKPVGWREFGGFGFGTEAPSFRTTGYVSPALYATLRTLRMECPYWFLVLTSSTLAMTCRLRWPPQFTLRQLFIATTFLAVVLGMIVWLDRAWIGK
jgi:hypothetical protein